VDSLRPQRAMRQPRLHRKILIALIASLALALSSVGIQSASASTRPRLAMSLNPDRSSMMRLNGSTVKGTIYVFLRSSKTLEKVDFYLDSRRQTQPPIWTEEDPPFDFAGTAADGTALPYDTTKLADGSHTIRVVLSWSDGETSSRRVHFTVANNGPTATPTALPTTPTTATRPASPTPTPQEPTSQPSTAPITQEPTSQPSTAPITQEPTSNPSTQPASSTTVMPTTTSSPSATKEPTAAPTAATPSPRPEPTATSSKSPTPTPSGSASSLAPSGPIVIDGKSGTVIENVHVSSATSECITIKNSQNITIRNSDIGPCGRNAIKVQGSSSTKIVDNYIHSEHRPAGCCDTNDGVFASGTSGLLVQGNVVAFNESNIELQSAADVKVIGNYLLNPLGPFPRGQQVQSWNNSRNITVEDNRTLASTDTSKYPFAADQEDAINFGFTDGVTVRNNYVSGGNSPSGCGIITDQATDNAKFVNNMLVRTGQCGIGLGNGSNLVADGNKIFNNTAIPIPGAGNTALYVWSPSAPCGPVQVTNNIVYGVKPDGSISSFWNGGGCGNVTYVGNIGGQEAFNLLTPEAQKLPAPAIPPKPYGGVAPAPYINQTDLTP
jgi:Right handed beta helix region